MGQKVNPTSFRLGINRQWPSRWFFAPKSGAASVGKYPYAKYLAEDEAIRKVIKRKISQAGVAAVEIERTSNKLRVLIKAARPGLIIGQGGKGIEELSRAIEAVLEKLRGATAKDPKQHAHLSVNVEELKRSEVSAVHTAEQIAWDLEKRMRFRRLIKKYLDQVMQNRSVKGAKILLAGRLDGAEIARREWLRQGALPLQTLRSDIDYGQATAYTTYGTIGIKVWIYRGQVFDAKKKSSTRE
jgi:small subunit ribosomal protein S3